LVPAQKRLRASAAGEETLTLLLLYEAWRNMRWNASVSVAQAQLALDRSSAACNWKLLQTRLIVILLPSIEGIEIA
jgi:uncharacterized membrane protein YqjE